MKKLIPFLLLTGILPLACTKIPVADSSTPLVQKKYLVSLQGSAYTAYFQYDDSLRTTSAEFSQPDYISSNFMLYSGGQLQNISSGTDSLGATAVPVYGFFYDPSTHRIMKILQLNDSSYDSVGYDGLGRMGSVYRYSGSPVALAEYDTLTFDQNNDLVNEIKESAANNYSILDFTYDTAANPFQATNLGFVLAVLNEGHWEDLSAHNVTKRVYSTASQAAPTHVVIETDTDVYTYGSDGLPLTVTETQVNTVTGTAAYSFNYAYSLK